MSRKNITPHQVNKIDARSLEINIRIRPVKPEDVNMIDEMHDRISKDSLYFRYLSANKPGLQELKHLCSAETLDGMVIVATIDQPEEKVVGIAHFKFDPEDPGIAEPAILVEDSYQGCGLGKNMVKILSEWALQAGVHTFISYIHPVNQRVVRMIQQSGLPSTCKYNNGLKEIRVQLGGCS